MDRFPDYTAEEEREISRDTNSSVKNRLRRIFRPVYRLELNEEQDRLVFRAMIWFMDRYNHLSSNDSIRRRNRLFREAEELADELIRHFTGEDDRWSISDASSVSIDDVQYNVLRERLGR